MDDQIQMLLDQCRNADSDAIERLWGEYFPRLCFVARRHLSCSACMIQDEEDLAAIAIEQLVHGLGNDGYSSIRNRGELWALLVAITKRRATDAHRAAVRDRGESTDTEGYVGLLAALEQAVSSEPGPSELALFRDTVGRFFELLDQEQLHVAQRYLGGKTSSDIAAELGISRSTVSRRLKAIREKTAFLFDI